MNTFVQRLQDRLRPANELTETPGLSWQPAAVMSLITDHPSRPVLLFTLRAKHLRAHPGEVAFPGGRWESQDPNLLATALRETHEEVALPPAQVRILGAIKPSSTLARTQVTPFEGVVSHNVTMVPDPTELETMFRVPLNWFSAKNCLRIDEFSAAGVTRRIPAYSYREYEIWGFTAAVTQEILSGD